MDVNNRFVHFLYDISVINKMESTNNQVSIGAKTERTNKG